jgi:hypothetical protein
MAVPISRDYKSVQVLNGTSTNVRRKLLEHEARDGWLYVGSVQLMMTPIWFSRNQVIDRASQ